MHTNCGRKGKEKRNCDLKTCEEKGEEKCLQQISHDSRDIFYRILRQKRFGMFGNLWQNSISGGENSGKSLDLHRKANDIQIDLPFYFLSS